MISNSPNRRLGIVCGLAVIACLALINGWQYLRYQGLEAKHRAVSHNAEQLKKSVDQLYAALKRTPADDEFDVPVADTPFSSDGDNAENPRDLNDESPGALVRILPVAGLIIPPQTDGKATKPTTISSVEDLAKAIPNAESQAVIKKGVDLDKEQIVQFHWFGPKADKLDFSVIKGKKEVVFRFTPGEKTKDLHEQFHLFVLPRDATWKVESVR